MSDVLPSNKLSFLDFLYQVEVIDVEQLQRIHQQQIKEDGLVDYLVEQKIVGEKYIQMMQQAYQKVSFVDLMTEGVDQEIVSLLPESLSRFYHAIICKQADAGYQVAMKNPLDYAAVDVIANQVQSYVTPFIARTSDIDRSINLYFRKEKKIDRYAKLLSSEITAFEKKFRDDLRTKIHCEEHVGLLLLKAILYDAAQMQASDVHIELDDIQLRIRIRVDGDLMEHVLPNVSIGMQLFRIIKINADLDISVANVAQDGKMAMKLGGGMVVNARVSVVPVDRGVSAVIRILDQAAEFSDLKEVITDERTFKLVEQFLTRRQGMMLITGPTGSGKTTTLYTALKEINDKKRKIITIEDPVELFIPGLNQIEIKPEAQFDFAQALKACLRQDPDVVLVGEIRDENTANIGMRAAMTGHLVLSTLHTNDAVSSIARLINLKVPGYLLSSSVDLIIAQRLLRKICRHCMIDADVSAKQKEQLVALFGDEAKAIHAKAGAGCPFCRETGYWGRIGVFECLELTNVMKDALAQEDRMAFESMASAQLQGNRLMDQALMLLKSEVISLSELLLMIH